MPNTARRLGHSCLGSGRVSRPRQSPEAEDQLAFAAFGDADWIPAKAKVKGFSPVARCGDKADLVHLVVASPLDQFGEQQFSQPQSFERWVDKQGPDRAVLVVQCSKASDLAIN